jgi:hypothetical protein
MTVTLKPDLEEKLKAQARAAGLSIDEFVNRELELMVDRAPLAPILTPEEQAQRWKELLEQLSVDGPPLSDYAVSRESIFTREDEML